MLQIWPGPLLWEVCSDRDTEQLDERAVGRAERLHSTRDFGEGIEALFSGKLQRQEPDLFKAKSEQQQLVIRFKQVKGKDFRQNRLRLLAGTPPPPPANLQFAHTSSALGVS